MSLLPAPAISASEKHIAGHMVTVHGLSELSPDASHVSILWLHHGRTRSSADMADIAARTVGAWNQEQQSKERGLIAVAFDQRNHGTRKIFPQANDAWRGGNPYHAQDMFGLISGAVVDTRLLIDVIQGNLFPEKSDGYVDAHYVLGVSLGGHSTWQLLFADDRVTAGVVIIGCPDYMYLLSDRAKLSKLPTFSTEDNGASFLGTKDFPPDLVRACEKYDPRGLVFGPRKTPSWPLPAEGALEVKHILTSRLRGKRLLNCSGGDDKLVPYYCSKPFVEFMKGAQQEWSELDLVFDDRVYAGAGHEFSPGMVTDAVQFLVETTRTEGSRESLKTGETRFAQAIPVGVEASASVPSTKNTVSSPLLALSSSLEKSFWLTPQGFRALRFPASASPAPWGSSIHCPMTSATPRIIFAFSSVLFSSPVPIVTLLSGEAADMGRSCAARSH
ncbi:hypothetical protein PspLS_06741 [Pyricularia sp. CBS 133598]|nr:hypothetical protein PspLS_06741 [Pyricularia sp. CBS 133598]